MRPTSSSALLVAPLIVPEPATEREMGTLTRWKNRRVTSVTRRIFHRVKAPISLSVAGSGTISGATNNALLEVGRIYTLTAKPGKGHLFGGWSGSTSSVSLKLTFMMETNSALTATFPTNLFPTVQGIYNGLFYDTNDFQQASAGFLTLKVGSSGASSGKLLLNGGTHSVKGTLDAYGLGNFVVVRNEEIRFTSP